jgi:hypothetical protein
MARGRAGPARIRTRRQPVRGWTASWRGHRARRRVFRGRAGGWRGHLRGTGSHARTHHHDLDRRRSQGVSHPPRSVAGEARRACPGGSGDRRARPVRGARARRVIRPSRCTCRRRRHLRRPALLASAARCPHQPSAGTRGAARPISATSARTRTSSRRGSPTRCAVPRSTGPACDSASGACAAAGRCRGARHSADAGSGLDTCRGRTWGRRIDACSGRGREPRAPAEPVR